MSTERDSWSTTADSNTAVASINIAESCDPGNLNNAIRAVMAALANNAEVTVASAGTTNILGAASERVAISGTTTITSLGTGTNRIRFVRFTGALTLTHNATSLILPGGANITTAAGDTMIVVSDASSNARVVMYQRATTTFNAATFTPTITFATPGTLSVSYATQTGRYTRIGNLVHVYIQLAFTPTLGTASGAFRIAGLPFAAASNNSPLPVSNIGAAFDWTTGAAQIVGVTTISQTYVEINQLGDGFSPTLFTVARITDGVSHVLTLSGTYEAA